MLTPLARLSPSIRPARNAVATVTGTRGDHTGQLGKKALAILAALRRVRPYDTVSEFEHRHYGYGDLIVTGFANDRFKQLPCVQARSFGGNGGGGI